MAPVQVADYPDDVRVGTTIIPTPFQSLFPYALASGAVQGPFDMRQWSSLQFVFAPTGVAQRLAIAWVDDTLGSHALGLFRIDVEPGLASAMILRNRGPYVQYSVQRSAGGACAGNLFVTGSLQSGAGNTIENGPFVCNQQGLSVNGGGATFDAVATFGYVGPAMFSAVSSATSWQVSLLVRDFAATESELTRLLTTTGATIGPLSVIIPPLTPRIRITNNDAGAKLFTTSLVPLIQG